MNIVYCMHQVWSNDVIRAPEHRVLASTTTERFSVPFFYNPDYEALVQPASGNSASDASSSNSDNSAAETPHYTPILWGEFRRRRFEGDIADFGEEIQIEHFKVDRAK